MLSAPPWMKNSGRGSSELSTAIGRHAEERDDRAHRVAEQADAGVGDPLARETDHGLELEHLLDAERDGHAVAPRHAAIRIEDDVEPLAPQGDRDPEGALTLALVAPRDDDRLRRARLAEMPGAEVDAVGGGQLDLFVVGLELEGREGEVVEPDRLRRQEGAPVDLVG